METVDPERASDEQELVVLEVFEIREIGATLLAPADSPQTLDLSLSPEEELSRRSRLTAASCITRPKTRGKRSTIRPSPR